MNQFEDLIFLVHFTEDIEKHKSYLNDESNIVSNGSAKRIYFPTNGQEVQEIVNDANKFNIPVTISGGGTGISGGRVPLQGWLIATDNMQSIGDNSEILIDPETQLEYSLRLDEISDKEALLTVPVSITVQAIQNFVREKGWFYPPDPTERTAFIGGNISTNASGARSFKFNSTRKWIQRIQVVLPNGEMVEFDRSKPNGKIKSDSLLIETGNQSISVPRPSYQLPKVTKHVAGPVITDDSHPLDLFIGSNGIFGFVTEATLRLVRPPIQIYSMFVYCESNDQAFSLIQKCQQLRKNNGPIVPLSVEFFDLRATRILQEKEPRVKDNIQAVVMLEQDVYSEEELETSLSFYDHLFVDLDIPDSDVALTHTENEHHKFLRHWVAEYVIGLNRSFGQKLIVTDYSVPEENFKEFFDFLVSVGEEYVSYLMEREKLATGNPGYTLFGHAGDCHPHLTLLPRNEEEAKRAMDDVLKILEKTVQLGGSIASEHGLGKKFFGDRVAFWYQYGDLGIEEVTLMKRAIDPKNLLCPNNLVIL